MNIEDVKVCVIRIEGTNCEEESAMAFRRIGADAEIVHLKQLTREGLSAKLHRDLEDYQILMLPGGFSAGDYVRGGALLAARMKSMMSREINDFVEAGKPILGVCNGFQVLVELGLLPSLGTTMSDEAGAVLALNDSSRFECRPTILKHENKGNCIFTKDLKQGDTVMYPSAHAEGKFLLPPEEERKRLQALADNDQIVFKYVDEDGQYVGYPWNPNGALSNIAGICNEAGNVFGLMPHPERVFYRYTHPDWTRTGLGDMKGDGEGIFRSAVEYAAKKF